MSLADFWLSLESSEIALRIGESWWFPLLESIHVLGVVFVVGSLLMVDLRLMGAAATLYPVRAVSRELLPWTWGAFVVSVVTGIGLFITRAAHYIDNPAFQFKLALLALAGVNMLVFHFTVFKRVDLWNTQSTPKAAKLSALISLVAWAGVVLTGRWVGHLS